MTNQALGKILQIEKSSSIKITSNITQQSKSLNDESDDVIIEMKTDITNVASVASVASAASASAESLYGSQENNDNVIGAPAPRQMSRKEGQMAKLQNIWS